MSDSCLVKHRGRVLRNAALLIVLLLAIAAPLRAATSAPVHAAHIEVQFVTEQGSIQPGEPFLVGLLLKHDPTWHSYWINPGDSGFATSIAWELPAGFTAGELAFPYPHFFEGGGALAGYGYEGETILFTEITPPADLSAGTEIALKGKANWLACDPQTCVPGMNVALSITLPVSDTPGDPSPWKEPMDKHLAEVPKPAPGWKLEATREGEAVNVRVQFPAGTDATAEGLYFFPEKAGVINAAAPQDFSLSAPGVFEASLAKTSADGEIPESLIGVLYSPAGFGDLGNAILLSTSEGPPQADGSAGTGSPAPTDADAAATGADASSSMSLFAALVFSFLGGIILNIMPCVFPVISLKVMGFVNQAGESRRHIFQHGLVFAAGVLVFFWILAAIILIVRAGGNVAGWGLQLQQPAFVMGMAFLMVFIAMNLFGVFEFGTSMTGVGGKLISGTGLAGSFWNGALATLLATPCTGPFMASALGYAVGKPPLVSILIFTFLGLGMASPYVLLSAFPALIQKLPRPGPWMETFKQVMGFPMLAVAAWLFVVLGAQLSSSGMLFFFGGILLGAFALWLYGRFATPAGKSGTRSRARLATVAVLIGAVLLSAKATTLRAPITSDDIAEIIQTHRAAGKNVFVDFTAVWCATCQANKPALHSQAVEKAFAQHNVEFVIADYTNNDPRITEFLQAYQRDGVPFYPLFPADPDADPIILPQALTPGIIVDYVNRLP